MLQKHIYWLLGEREGGWRIRGGGEGLKEDVCCNHCLGMDGWRVCCLINYILRLTGGGGGNKHETPTKT